MLKKFIPFLLFSLLISNVAYAQNGSTLQEQSIEAISIESQPEETPILYSSDNQPEEQDVIKLSEPESLSLSDFGVEETFILNGQSENGQDINLEELKEKLNSVSEQQFVANSGYTPDNYEPNNNFYEAFPYSQTTKMTGHPFTEGYMNAGIHDEFDDDYYSINLKANTDYFFHLKNLSADYDMILVDPAITQYWAIPQTGTTEEYFYFNPGNVSGTYYIVILGNGNSSFNHYFLFAGEAIVTKTLHESTGLTFNFNGAGTTGYLSYNTIGKIPQNAVLNEVFIDSNGTGYWVGLTKYLKAANGMVYSNQDGSGIDYIQYPANTQYAAQNWSIAGKTATGTSNFSWKPNIRMKYTYVMTP